MCYCGTRCTKFTNCLVHSLVFFLYFLGYIAPSSTQIALLVTFHDNIEVVKIILISFSSLIMGASIFMSLKLTIDLFTGEPGYDETCNCCFGTNFHLSCNSDALCFNIFYVNGLASGCFWMTLLIPWIVCNIASMGYFWVQLVEHGAWWIMLMVFAPFFIPLIGVPIGYMIRKSCC